MGCRSRFPTFRRKCPSHNPYPVCTTSPLGRSGLKVCPLGLGIMNFGPHATEADSFAIMDHAPGIGVQFFDTADVYAAPAPSTKSGRRWKPTRRGSGRGRPEQAAPAAGCRQGRVGFPNRSCFLWDGAVTVRHGHPDKIWIGSEGRPYLVWNYFFPVFGTTLAAAAAAFCCLPAAACLFFCEAALCLAFGDLSPICRAA